jgi:hypothetical protein
MIKIKLQTFMFFYLLPRVPRIFFILYECFCGHIPILT